MTTDTPDTAATFTPERLEFIASALEVGADDEGNDESDYDAARGLIDDLRSLAEGRTGAIVIRVDRESGK